MNQALPHVRLRSVVALSLLMTMVLLTFAAQQPVVLVAGTFMCAFYAIAKHWPVRISNKNLFVFLCVCTLFLPAFLKLDYRLSSIFYFFSTLSMFFAAKAATSQSPAVFLAAFRIVYTGAIVSIAIILYVYWGQPEPFGQVIEGSSTNGIPTYLIVVQIGLILSNYVAWRQIPIISPILTGAVAFFGNGRGSLVVAGLIIIACILFNLALMRTLSRARQLIFVLFLMMIVIGIVWQGDELFDMLINYTKLSVGLEDSNRIEIFKQYVEKLNLWTFLTGADYTGTVIDYEYMGNPHIAYIRTHSFFGLPITLLALFSPLFVLFSSKSLGAKMVFLCFIALAALRAVSEPIFFPTLLDFFYFCYFFLFFRYAPDSRPSLIMQARPGANA